MNYALLSRIAGGILMLAIGFTLALGSKALWNGRPSNWPDLTASDETVIASSRWALPMAAIFVICAIGAFIDARWTFVVSVSWLVIALAVLFWGHYVLFGHWDWVRMAINVAVAALIVWLLSVGRAA